MNVNCVHFFLGPFFFALIFFWLEKDVLLCFILKNNQLNVCFTK
uniref:Uncharacterized protein n=1 Tax=Anguilla anguilla TaxID=7936 RepID=A0A0E9WCA3_ANGAN